MGLLQVVSPPARLASLPGQQLGDWRGVRGGRGQPVPGIPRAVVGELLPRPRDQVCLTRLPRKLLFLSCENIVCIPILRCAGAPPGSLDTPARHPPPWPRLPPALAGCRSDPHCCRLPAGQAATGGGVAGGRGHTQGRARWPPRPRLAALRPPPSRHHRAGRAGHTGAAVGERSLPHRESAPSSCQVGQHKHYTALHCNATTMTALLRQGKSLL